MEVRSARRDYDEWVWLDGIGPASRYGSQPAVIVMEEDPILAPRLPTCQELELAPEERMERVRHPEESRRRDRISCS
jgi:hypothetical protein